MEILTNKVKIEFDNINSRFDIYSLSITYDTHIKNLFNKVEKLVDSIKKEKVCSIYRYGSKFKIYFLIEKNSNKLNIDELFDEKELNYFKDFNLIKYFGIDKFITENEKLNLLLNGIKIYNYYDEKYECFDGKLYEVIKSHKDFVIALKYSFEDMCLKADVVTFRKYQNYNNDKRVFQINEKYLSKTSRKCSGYIIEGESGTKHNLDYFSGKSLTSLENCKVYRIMNIYKRFNEFYSDIYKISFQKDNMHEKRFENINHKTKSDRKYALELVRDKGINIIDNVGNRDFLEKIINYFETNNINVDITYDINREKLNLNIIYSKQYYEEKGIDDKHITSLDYVVQNIIYDMDEDKLDKNKMNVIIAELIHKYELNIKRILHHKHDNKIIKKFIFGRIKKIKDNKYVRCELSIENGNMFINKKEESKNDNGNIKEQIYIKDKMTNKIYEIILLPKYPLTEINDLVEAYYNTTIEINVKEKIIPILIKYKISHFNYCDILVEFEKFINKYDTVSMSTLYNKIKIELFPEDPILRCKYSNCLKDLNKYLWNNKTIYFKPLWRSKEQPIKQAFEKFKYKNDNIDYFQYYSGCSSSLNQSIYNGFPYRQIKYNFSEEEINDYLRLLDVDDVRNNQNTVIPFPFKYITEILNIYYSVPKNPR